MAPTGLSVSPDDLLGLVVRHAVHADGVHPGAGEVLAVEHREPAIMIRVQYSTAQYSTAVPGEVGHHDGLLVETVGQGEGGGGVPRRVVDHEDPEQRRHLRGPIRGEY